jgi:hypothetical protein
MDWRERYERAATRYAAGEMRDLDERQLVQLANSAWAAGLSLLMDGDRDEAGLWLRRSAERYRESWDAGGTPDAWGRPLGAMKALLIAGDDAADAARWTLETCLGVRHLDLSLSPIGRYAGVLALLVLGRDEEAGEVAKTLGDGFPGDVADALSALANHDPGRYREAVALVRRSFEEREAFLEDVPVPDTAIALDVLAASRGLG